MDLADRLRDLRRVLSKAVFPLPDGTAMAGARDRVIDQLEDYVIPRVERLDAPLVAVVGGSTGAGKSTLVNSLLGQNVTAASALRPTTRRPLLVHHPDDAKWFSSDRILPSFVRVTRSGPGGEPTDAAGNQLEMLAAGGVPQGVALIDAPDVDSVVETNRLVAAQLLGAADLWIFVTTAARYADAVPWEFLREAHRKNVVVAIVLDRVPEEAGAEVEADMRRYLADADLGEVPLFTVVESALVDGKLPEEVVAPVRSWLGALSADAAAREEVARQTIAGALDVALGDSVEIAAAAHAQVVALDEYADAALAARAEALTRLQEATADGTLLRGEVLARWQEFVGTGEFLRLIEAKVGLIRDRIGRFLRGRPAPALRMEEALEEGLHSLLVSEAMRARTHVDRAWRIDSGGRGLLAAAEAGTPSDDELSERASRHVVAWQSDLLDMIRKEGADRRFTARMLSFGVNGLGVALMILIFAQTGGLTGAEVATAGGAAVVGQKLLEAIFGEDGVRRMAKHSRRTLQQHSEQFLTWCLGAYTGALDDLEVDPNIQRRIELAVADVRSAHRLAQRSGASW